MQCLLNIKNSIYNPQYYSEVLTKRFSYSLKHYFLFSLCLSLILSAYFFVSFVGEIKMFADNIESKITNYYPEELKIEIKDGKASSNVPEPYFLKMPSEMKSEKDPNFQNFLVIDTKGQFSMDKFNSYQTASLLTEDFLVYYNDKKGITIQPLKDIPNFVLDRKNLEFYANKIKPFLKLIYPLSFIAIFLANLSALLFWLVYLLFAALLVWLAAKIKGMKIGYLNSYKLGIHLLTLGILINFAAKLFHASVPIPFFFTILLIVLAFLNIKKPVAVQ